MKKRRPLLPDELRCRRKVYIPGQLVYTGRGKHGFERHYEERRCLRAAVAQGMCRQHQRYAKA